MIDDEANLVFEKDVAIEMDDGLCLRANIFRPIAPGRYPVIMAHGVYGKDIHFEDGYPVQWGKLLAIYPELCSNGSTGKYLRWETVDPERWVSHGYVVIQVDSRGTGKSPGYLDPRCPREIRDYYQCIEWAGIQPWSNGRVGLSGISYYAFTQWAVAALQPPHLAAIIPWEGFVDPYRDRSYKGGIPENSAKGGWWVRQVLVNQHGNGETRYIDRDTGQPTTGAALSETLLRGNRRNPAAERGQHDLCDAWHQERTPDLTRITIPVLSAGNWGGPCVHLRGNIDGFTRVGSAQKWLSMHIGTHWDSYYLPDYVAVQKRFFDHFLKGVDNGWDREPRVQLAIRRADQLKDAPIRAHEDFPLSQTKWTKFYLDTEHRTLQSASPSGADSVTYAALDQGVTFTTAPFDVDTEFTGYVMARLWMASSTADLDIFATLRIFDPQGDEIIIPGAHEPTPMSRGWLRASHRKLDAALSLPYRPFRTHDEIQKLVPGEVYPLDVEIWPTCMVFPKGYRLALTLQGQDFEFPGILGRFTHDHQDRLIDDYAGRHTIHSGGAYPSYLLMPLIPQADQDNAEPTP